ncbi:MAG TPA: TIGR04255 family protein [Longimicrobium sp.]|nr:TIGR04255 family protein [Longimicrobium sp.]
MADVRHLSRAPLTEALVDFRIPPHSPSIREALEALAERLGDEYPNKDEQEQVGAHIELARGEVVAEPIVNRFYGFLCRSQDGLSIAQFRIDGFTYNRLRPYTSWKELLPEAMRLWGLYCQATGCEGVIRLGLRYINHLSIPSGAALSDYLLLGPAISPTLPGNVQEFLTRVVLHDIPDDLTAAVTVVVEPIGAEDKSVLLDVDAFSEMHAPADSPTVEETLQVLHDFKNRIFFNSLTDAAIRRYE